MAQRVNERPIIIRKRKSRAHAAHHGGAWKVAYADFVTAMMAFFMLLWLVANPDKEQLKGLAEYFTPQTEIPQGSTGRQPGVGGRTTRSQAESKAVSQPTDEAAAQDKTRGGTANIPDSAMRVLANELRIALDTIPSGQDSKDSVRVESSREGLRLNLMDTAGRPMFRGGTAVLNDYARIMLGDVARKLVKTGVRIAIEGHTDAVGGQSDANWRLSGERAQAARAAMGAAGLTPDRFAEVVAMAGSQPIYPDQPGRPENRRITIVVLAEGAVLPSDVSFKF